MRLIAMLLALGLALPSIAPAQESGGDALPGVPFKEGDTISFEQVDKLKEFLPPQFWENREYFFYEGMQLQIGPS